MPEPSPLYRLAIRDLMLSCSIGAYDAERRAPQRVRVNIVLWVRRRPGTRGDRLAEVLDYDRIADGVRALAGRGHINLLETLAQKIVDLSLAEPLVEGVRVAAEKPDVYVDAGGVAVEVEACRDGRPATA